MTSTWIAPLTIAVLLAVMHDTTAVFSCATTRERLQPACRCDEKVEYFNITCPLGDGKTFDIIVNSNKFEIDCRGHVIDNVSLVPLVLDEDIQEVEYFGFVDCPMQEFVPLTKKMISDMKVMKYLALKKIDRMVSGVYDGFQVNTLMIEYCLVKELPEDLLYKLEDLSSIFINNNDNITTLPEGFFKRTRKLQSINLGQNNLTSLPVKLLANLTDLINLSIFANKISTIETGTFEGLTNLQILELMTNRLTTLPPDAFKHLPHLRRLSLRKNLFRTMPEGLFRYNIKLFEIQFNDNPYLTTLPERFFANLSQLEKLSMSMCNLTAISDNIFWGTENLRILNLGYNRLKHLGKDLFRDTINLENLYLDHNMLETIDEEIFTKLNKLQTLQLGNNNLKIMDNTFYGLKNLKILYLDHNALTTLTRQSMRHFKSLVTLDMSYNNLTLAQTSLPNYAEENFSILPQLANLTKLNLQHNEISSIFKDWTFTLSSLEDLNLANNKIPFIHYRDLQFLQDHTVTMNLENNLISTINLSTAEQLIEINFKATPETSTKPKIIILKGNPIICDCRIYDFVRYIDGSMNQIVKRILRFLIDDLKCQAPEKYNGTLISTLQSKSLTCVLDDGPKLPEKCRMQHYEYRQFDKRIIMDCSNTNLTEVPTIVFKQLPFMNMTLEVSLRGNRITSLPKPGMGYENVVELDLSHNMINEITWVPKNIQILKLHNNNLTYLNNDELLLINRTTIKNVTFHNNPWKCNCNLLNFTKYLQENFKKIPNLHNITCADDGYGKIRELTSLSSDDLCSHPIWIIATISVFLAIFAVIICALIAVYYNYNQQIKVWMYARNLCLYLITEEEIDQDKIYDAFVSFSHEDEDFVVGELLPGLEEGPTPFKLCVHFRDWQPGEFITTNIARSIDASRRTVVVVSQGFLKSEWGKMEFRTAHTEAMKEGRARVVVVVYGDIGPLDDLDPEIRAYFSTNTYIKWGTPWFWDNLRYAMPHSSKYARVQHQVTFQQPAKIPSQFGRDKADLIHEPSTPPAATTPPADAVHRMHDPLLPPSALNVSLINGTLINAPSDKTKNNNTIYDMV